MRLFLILFIFLLTSCVINEYHIGEHRIRVLLITTKDYEVYGCKSLNCTKTDTFWFDNRKYHKK